MEYMEESIIPTYVFGHENEFIENLQQANKILLCLDFDGTLVSFKNDPNDVKIPPHIQSLIEQFRSKKKYDVVIITGRTLKDIKDKISIGGINIAAVHGLHIEFSDGNQVVVDQAKSITSELNKIKKETDEVFANEKGVHVEDKKYTIAFHYRMASKENATSFKEQFIQIAKKYDTEDSIQILKGDKVIEVRPLGWNKGSAVHYLLQNIPHESSFYPLYIGDDTTDEDAFQYIDDMGLTIFVKNDSRLETHASYYVNDPEEVVSFLRYLVRK